MRSAVLAVFAHPEVQRAFLGQEHFVRAAHRGGGDWLSTMLQGGNG